ncbi:MAG TPA: phasin family protein [Chloroflexota bacterium]|jgi:poly(hydroxyalkanoate) granule-associated protein|nr:phasin family protein [Chloroflexota bacterium]
MNNKETETGTTPGGSSEPEFVTPIEAAKRVALAGLGAVAVATEATDEVFRELVKKGEQARHDVAGEMREARAKTAGRRSEATDFFRARMDDAMNAVNLPSKGDVDAINAKLNILTRKMDEFQASQVDRGTADKGPENTGSA